MTPVELLTSFLPASLRISKCGSKRVRFNGDGCAALSEVKQNLFDKEGESRKISAIAWFDPERERQELEKFLTDHMEESVWQLLRHFLDYMFR